MIITEKIHELGEFRWEDPQSEQLVSAKRELLQIKPEMVLPSNIRYAGEWTSDGRRHGRGTLTWPDGARYDGYFVDNYQEGLGRIIHSDGDVYVGYWKKDRSYGMGTYTHMDGAYYEGFWVDDKHHGYGKEVWADGAIFEGDYR